MKSKTIYSAGYRRLVKNLRLRREEAGFTQTALAAALGWPQQSLSAIEAGARRLDIFEFMELTSMLGLDPVEAVALLGTFKPRAPRVRKRAPPVPQNRPRSKD